MRFVIILISTFLISCASYTAKKTNLEKIKAPSIEELFLSLPLDAFFISKIQPTLFYRERQIILKSTTVEQAVALSSNFLRDTTESSSNFLIFNSYANDEGISVLLKTWQRKDESLIVGVNISKGDMCCDFSRLKLYHYKDAEFEDVTELVFPKLKIEDFVPDIDAKTKALFPSLLQLSIFAFPENDFLEVSIDHTPMFFDLEVDLRARDLKLAWRNDKFIIHKN